MMIKFRRGDGSAHGGAVADLRQTGHQKETEHRTEPRPAADGASRGALIVRAGGS